MADPDVPIAVFQWSGPEGQTTNKQRFLVHTTNLQPATYTVTLVVRDQRQRQSRATATLIVEAKARDDVNAGTPPPVARITPNRLTVEQRHPARFDGRGSTSAAGKIRAWTWSLNDKLIDRRSSTQIDTHGLVPGTYRVRLEVTDEQGVTARDAALLVVVEPKDFDAAIVELDVLPAPVSPNQEARIRAVAANRGKDPLRNIPVRFETGGTRIAEIVVPSLAPGETKEVAVSWIPRAAKQHILIATINPESQPRETNRTNNRRRYAVTMLAQPSVRIHPNPLELSRGESARFTSRVLVSGQPAGDVKYFWRGPGGHASDRADFQFDTSDIAPGDHKIVLDISARGDRRATASATLIVRPVVADVWITADTESHRVGGEGRFTTGTRPQLSQVQYKFNFGDGTKTTWSSHTQAAHRYDSPGNYTVTASARRSGVNLGDASIGISVKEVAYAVILRAETTSVRTGDSLSFIADAEPPAPDAEYRFHFGDGQESGWMRNPRTAHAYSGGGSFEASVEARIGGAQIIRSAVIRVDVLASPWPPPWLWVVVFLAVVAAAAAIYARIQKNRSPKLPRGFAIKPVIDFHDLRVEKEGEFASGCDIGLRAVRGRTRFDVEAAGPIVNGRDRGG